MAYDIGGRGDKSFNDSAAAGLDAAKAKYNLADSDVKELEAAQGEAEADKEARLTQLADNGFTTIIAVGFAYADAVKAVVSASTRTSSSPSSTTTRCRRRTWPT